MRRRWAVGLFAIAVLLAGCSSATFPTSSDAGIVIELQASGGATVRVVAPSGVNPETLAADLAPAMFGARPTEPPVADGPNAARIDVASAFDPTSPRFALDAAGIVRLARIAGAGDVLLEICAPSGVPVTIEQGPGGAPEGGCARWSFAPGQPAAPLAMTLHPSAARLWILTGVSVLMVIGCAFALAAFAVRRERWSRSRRVKAVSLGIVGGALLVAWFSVAAAAMDGNVHMVGVPAALAALARVVAFSGLAAAFASASIGMLALSRPVRAPTEA